MQQIKNTVNLRDLKNIDKHRKIEKTQNDCLHNLKDALDVTMRLTKAYLENKVFDYCLIAATIGELEQYMKTANHREAQILISKISNIFEVKPANKSIMTQMPIKQLLKTAKARLLDKEAYKGNNHNKHNYDFMVNMLTLERALAQSEHPFIILSLNAENLFTALLTAWKINQPYAEEKALEICEILKHHKEESPFFETTYKNSAFLCLEALCFDICVKHIQKANSSVYHGEAVHC
jgi:hypothetical protein